MILKNTLKRIICLTAVFLMVVGLLPVVETKAEPEIYESGYNFNSEINLRWDLGDNNLLTEYSTSPLVPVEGRFGHAVKSSFSFAEEMFDSLDGLTFGLWLKNDEILSSNAQIFYYGTGNDGDPYISFEVTPGGTYIVSLFDGVETVSASITSPSKDWMHITFTYKPGLLSGGTLALYCNGRKMSETASNVNLSDISGGLPYITDFLVDEIYVSNGVLGSMDILLLSTLNLEYFFVLRGFDIKTVTPNDNDFTGGQPEPEDPVFPFEPEEPEIPQNPDEWTLPAGISKTNFTWLAYTFDGTFNAQQDLNKQVNANIDSLSSTLVTLDEVRGGGRGLTRRTNVFPTEYMSLDRGLLFDSDTFTIAMWVYRETDRESESYPCSNMNLLEFTGKGSFIFAPFKTDLEGTSTPVLTVETEKYYGNDPLYVDLTPPVSYPLTKTSLRSVNNKWVHYALTYDQNGTVTIYMNGAHLNTTETGVKLTDLDLTELKIMTGSSETDESRYYIDDVYVSSKVLEAADIRRIHHYGVSRFVTEVLADPNPENQTEEPSSNENLDLRPDSTDELEDAVYETAEINDFIGTTFDDMSLIGADYNNSVLALIRNASLAQGSSDYGLALDGMTSYIRYPLGILDEAEEMTVSIAYKWAGSTTGSNHRLFDFSRKDSSVSTPSAYMYLDMGNGTDGMKFVIGDEYSELVLTTDHNVVDKWVRVSVTIKNNVARLYIDGAEVASGETFVTPATIKPNYNYVGKSGVKGGSLFKGTVDEIYISDTALTALELQTIQTYGIEPYTPTGADPVEIEEEIDIWDAIINGVVIFAGALIVILIIVIIVTIVKR